jgi:CheY-like chemotaxis protein
LFQRFSRVKVVVCAKEDNWRQILDATERLGITDTVFTGNLDAMMAMMNDQMVDLLVCDFSFLGEELLAMAQKIRRKVGGRNPFVLLIVTSETPDAAALKALIDAGIDDFLRAPFSVERLAAGIEKFVEGRRPFVASYDYVGPTRRAPVRDRKDATSLIDVPNTLLSKVVHDASDLDLQRMIDVAEVALEDRQGETRAAQMNNLAESLCRGWREGASEQITRQRIAQLRLIAQDFIDRNVATAPPQIINFVKMLLVLTDRIRQAGLDQANTDMQLLENLTQAIRRALTVERDAVALMGEIIEAVARH